MSSPIEFRYYLRSFTLADLAQGAQPMRLPSGMYAPPVLQYRYKERVPNGAETTLQWSEWIAVPVMYEGQEGFQVGDLQVHPDTIRQ